MKPASDLGVAHEGTVTDSGGISVKMSLDEAVSAHLMDVLTKLYKDPLMAIIREYPSNAYDSHVEAGNTAPIEVRLPTPINNNFVVIDRGVGMSKEEILDNCSRYGRSTKRGTDKVAGMLGLGFKAALALVRQFSITSTKNGFTTTALICQGTDGVGDVKIPPGMPLKTDNPDGVKVSIAIPGGDIDAFNEKADWFFQYWQPGTVLVNGKQPELETVAYLDPDVALTEDSYNVIVQGNIPYVLDKTLLNETLRPHHPDNTYGRRMKLGGRTAGNSTSNHSHSITSTTIHAGTITGSTGTLTAPTGWNPPDPQGISNPLLPGLRPVVSVVVRVPIGSVHFTPNREELQYSDPRTKDTLFTIQEYLYRRFPHFIQKGIDAFDKPSQALTWMKEFVSLGEFTHRGVRYDGWGQIKLPRKAWSWDTDYVKGDATGTWREFLSSGNVTANYFTSTTLLIVNYPHDQVSKQEVDCTTAYLQDRLGNNAKVHRARALLTRGSTILDDPWLPPNLTIVDWSEVWLHKPQAEKEYIEGRYAIATMDRDGYIRMRERRGVAKDRRPLVTSQKYSEHIRMNRKLFDGVPIQIVFLPPSKQERFLKAYPGAMLLKDWLRDFLITELRKLPAYERSLFVHNSYARSNGLRPPEWLRYFRNIPLRSIDDPKLRRYISQWQSLSKREGVPIEGKERIMRDGWYLFNDMGGSTDQLPKNLWTSISNKEFIQYVHQQYPLIIEIYMGGMNSDMIRDYVNAMYCYTQKGRMK